MRTRIRAFFQSLAPSPRAWHGAAWGVLAVTAILWLIDGRYLLSEGRTHLGMWLTYAAITVAAPLAGLLVRLILNLLRARNRFFSWTVAACLALLILVFLSGTE